MTNDATTHIRLPSKLKQQSQQMAKQHGMKYSQFIRIALKEYVRKQK